MALATKPLFSPHSPLPTSSNTATHSFFFPKSTTHPHHLQVHTNDAADYPLSAPELDEAEAGAAAQTRGDVFIQTHHSSAASSAVLAEMKKKD